MIRYATGARAAWMRGSYACSVSYVAPQSHGRFCEIACASIDDYLAQSLLPFPNYKLLIFRCFHQTSNIP